MDKQGHRFKSCTDADPKIVPLAGMLIFSVEAKCSLCGCSVGTAIRALPGTRDRPRRQRYYVTIAGEWLTSEPACPNRKARRKVDVWTVAERAPVQGDLVVIDRGERGVCVARAEGCRWILLGAVVPVAMQPTDRYVIAADIAADIARQP